MKKLENSLTREEEILKDELLKTKLALESAYSNFESVIDPDLIDSSIYELNAVQKRYRFLLKQAKELDNKKEQPQGA